jgi:TetR/AcrR family transcriptional regulator
MTPLSLNRSPDPGDDLAKGQIRQANEALILAAAERVFAGAGFGGATMAAIADASGLPKANLHYYFGSKQALYRTVLARTLTDWLLPAQAITLEADPKTAIEAYIRAKMLLSKQRPHASKVFANELLHGAPVVKALTWSPPKPPYCKAGWTKAAWPRSTRCTCSLPSGLLPKLTQTLMSKCAPCSAARS